MTKVLASKNTFIVPVVTAAIEGAFVENEVFRHLLNGRSYVSIGTQILFEKEGQYFVTMIDNDQQHYTLEDYKQLPFKAPYQLINGKLEYMASPKDKHQDTLGNLYLLLAPYVKNHQLGKVRFAPLDVHFDKDNIYQPDLMFISNERKDIIKDFIYGAPDLIVEILSSNKKHDLVEKKEVYGAHQVLEYWAIDYKKETLDVYLNENKKLVLHQQYQKDDNVNSIILPDFSFSLTAIFEA